MKNQELKRKKFKKIGGVMAGIGFLLMFTSFVVTGFGLILLGLILFFVGMAKTQEETDELIKKESTFRKTLKGLIVLILFIFVGIAIFGGEDNKSQTQQESYQKQNEVLDDISILVEAQDFVKQALKSPATADFPYQHIVNRLGNNRYEVVSYVDSQNSFGAMIRTNWNVVLRIENGRKYLEKMVMDGSVVYQSTNSKNQTFTVDNSAQPQDKNPVSSRTATFGEKVKLPGLLGGESYVTVYSVGEYTAKYDKPRDGYKFVYIDAKIENLTDEDLHCSLLNLLDDKGKEYDIYKYKAYIGLGDDSSFCAGATISPFKKSRGYEIFEVPQTRQSFQVEYRGMIFKP